MTGLLRAVFALILFTVAASALAQSPAPAQAVEVPGQPFAPVWFPHTLLKWSPQTDPDAPYNRSRVPLGARFLDPATLANTHAWPGGAGVTAIAAFAGTANNPSQGTAHFDYYAVNYWQYLASLVFWGGSAGEGSILAPNPTVTDAAHRNGVPVLGTIFFPPNVYGGQIQWVRDLVQKSGSIYPVADKLIQAARYYGFDGWFINQETGGGDADLAAQVRDFMKYFKARSSLRLMWYDAMNESGAVGWQGALNTANDLFFQDNGRVSDEMFLDFRWTPARLQASRRHAQSIGRGPYDLFAGVDVEGSGYNKTVAWNAIFPEKLPPTVSLGFYRPEWTYKSSSSVADYYQRDNRFWVGPNRDPSNTRVTAGTWPGVAHYVAEQSPITKIPFVTNFNTGQGRLFAVNGAIVGRGEWNNLSLQDVLPTWRWRINSSGGAKLVPDLDWDDAYYGGTSLKVSGALTAANHLKLFSTRLVVSPNTHLRLAYKTGRAGAPTRLQVGLAFKDDPARFEYLDVGSAGRADWNSVTFSLGRHAKKTIRVLSLRFLADAAPVNDYAIRIGQIALFNGAADVPAGPSNVRVERRAQIAPDRASLRLRWNRSPDPVYYYNVYRRNGDNSRTYLGGTPNDAYFVASVARVGSEPSTTIEVEAVGTEFGHSAPVRTRIVWPRLVPTSRRVTKTFAR